MILLSQANNFDRVIGFISHYEVEPGGVGGCIKATMWMKLLSTL